MNAWAKLQNKPGYINRNWKSRKGAGAFGGGGRASLKLCVESQVAKEGSGANQKNC